MKCLNLNPAEQLRSKFSTHQRIPTYSNFGTACQISHIFPTVEQPVKQPNCSHSTAVDSPAKVYTNQSYFHSTAEEQTAKSLTNQTFLQHHCLSSSRQITCRLEQFELNSSLSDWMHIFWCLSVTNHQSLQWKQITKDIFVFTVLIPTSEYFGVVNLLTDTLARLRCKDQSPCYFNISSIMDTPILW